MGALVIRQIKTMGSENKLGIIVQARMGSSRLPGKMGRKFYNGKSLLEIVIERILSASGNLPVVIATTKGSIDDYIVNTSKNSGALVFRGSEEDVMSRFIGAADMYQLNTLIRICADNPFIQPKYIKQLINYNKDLTADYVGFRLNKTHPGIKTHLGFFPERVKLKALKEVYKPGLDSKYKEHVTNYFYSRDNEKYLVNWIELNYPPNVLEEVRLTIDVEGDFVVSDKLYKYLNENGMEGDDVEIIKYLREHPSILREMKTSIIKNEK